VLKCVDERGGERGGEWSGGEKGGQRLNLAIGPCHPQIISFLNRGFNFWKSITCHLPSITTSIADN
jgi:hypothetical protein